MKRKYTRNEVGEVILSLLQNGDVASKKGKGILLNNCVNDKLKKLLDWMTCEYFKNAKMINGIINYELYVCCIPIKDNPYKKVFTFWIKGRQWHPYGKMKNKSKPLILNYDKEVEEFKK